VDPPTFKILPCYKDSSNITPLIFVLSAGTDPVMDFRTFAEEEDMWKRTEMISLGQGQGKKAERMIDDAKTKGGWVLL
jgi:dynein heavy chain